MDAKAVEGCGCGLLDFDRKVGVVVSLSGVTMLLGLMPWLVLVLVLVLVALVGPKIMHLILHFQLLNVPVVVDHAES